MKDMRFQSKRPTLKEDPQSEKYMESFTMLRIRMLKAFRWGKKKKQQQQQDHGHRYNKLITSDCSQ